MPTLPDDSALGGMPGATYSRPIAAVDTAPLTQGVKDLGTGIASLGGDLYRTGAEKQAKSDAMATARAGSDFLVGKANLDDNLTDITDPEEARKHAEKYDQLGQTIAQQLPDGAARDQFMVSHAPAVAGAKIAATNYAFKLETDQQLAGDNQRLIDLRQAALKSQDPAEKAKLIDQGTAIVNAQKDNGYITAQQAQQRSQAWVTDYSVANVNSMPPGQRIAALSQIDLSGDETSRTMQILRSREGFKSNAYWDVNHQRVGYGSDTITQPDGTVKEVKQGDSVTQADAERDLARRTAISLSGVRDSIGDDAYNKLSPNAKAALGSVAYNYGTLPNSVAEAAKAGDASAVGDAIERLQGDNNGVNKSRRIVEASIARGGAVSGGSLVKFIPEDKRIDLLNQAERDFTQQERTTQQAAAQEHATVASLMKDDEQSTALTGTPLASLTPERVGAAMGPQAQSDFLHTRELAQKYHDQTRDWDQVNESEINNRVESLNPKAIAGQPGFAQASRYYDAAHTAAEQIIKGRYDDPAGAVSHFPAVQAAAKDTQGGFIPVIKARMASQEAIGIPEAVRSPITEDEAKRYSALLRPLSEGQASIVDQTPAIEGVVNDVKAKYGPYFQPALSRILSHATMKKDASDVMASAVEKAMQPDSGPLTTAEDARRVQIERDAQRAAAIAGQQSWWRPFSSGDKVSSQSLSDLVTNTGGTATAAPARTAPQPSPPTSQGQLKPFRDATDLLRSDPDKLMTHFVQKFGPDAVPADLISKMPPDLAAKRRFGAVMPGQ